MLNSQLFEQDKGYPNLWFPISYFIFHVSFLALFTSAIYRPCYTTFWSDNDMLKKNEKYNNRGKPI